MDPIQAINEIANLLICVNTTLFYIFVFGRDVKVISNLNIIEQWMLRLGLILPAVGSLYNVLTAQYPPIPEIVMNIGWASLFTWASIFHYKTFVKNAKK
jgi:hypothetical protein